MACVHSSHPLPTTVVGLKGAPALPIIPTATAAPSHCLCRAASSRDSGRHGLRPQAAPSAGHGENRACKALLRRLCRPRACSRHRTVFRRERLSRDFGGAGFAYQGNHPLTRGNRAWQRPTVTMPTVPAAPSPHCSSVSGFQLRSVAGTVCPLQHPLPTVRLSRRKASYGDYADRCPLRHSTVSS
jgi:hypothetical protein